MCMYDGRWWKDTKPGIEAGHSVDGSIYTYADTQLTHTWLV